MSSTIASEIPIEILGKILLLLCLRPIDVPDPNGTKQFEYFPWAAGLVSKHWRDAFLSTPTLWTSLRIIIKKPDNSNPNLHTEIVRRLRLYLERSCGHPLNITASSHVPQEAWRVLLSQSYRWRYASINVSGLETATQFDEYLAFSGNIPILEELQIEESIQEFPCRAFEIAPSLKRVDLVNWDEKVGWIMPWSQLTELHLRLGHASQILDGEGTNVLSKLDNIEKLTISLLGDFFATLEPPSSVPRLDSLRFLSVEHPFFLSLLEAPRLDELHLIKHYFSADDLYNEELSNLIRRSSCKISHLYLFDLDDTEDIQRVMSSCPHVEDLYYSNVYHGRDVISVFSNLNDNASLPRLRSLTVGYSFKTVHFQSLVRELSKLMENRARNGVQSSGASPLANFEPMETVTLRLLDGDMNRIPPELSEAVRKWHPVVHAKLQDKYI